MGKRSRQSAKNLMFSEYLNNLLQKHNRSFAIGAFERAHLSSGKNRMP